MNKNTEKYDLRITEDVPWNLFLSKSFVKPKDTPEAELAELIDKEVEFDYKKTLFYQVRSGRVSQFISPLPVKTNWWDMPWLNEAMPNKKKKKDHPHMLKLLNGFTKLFHSLKSNGLIVSDFQSRIRVDKLIRNGKSCYIYVDANKRMGILGYFVKSGQLTVDKIPIKMARIATTHHCKWMPEKKAKALFEHPFKVLEL